MKIPPHVNLLRSLRGKRIDYVSMAGEAIDNAFDAGASWIRITIGLDSIRFEDDGVGVTRDRIASLFCLGDHGSMETTRLGRFGIGIKSHAVNAGDIFNVESISKDGHFRLSANWSSILKSGEWAIEDPLWCPILVGAKTGTIITVTKLRVEPKRGIADSVLASSAEIFHPALKEGKRIIVNGISVLYIDEPEMSDIVDKKLSLSGGRSAHLRGGILKAPSKLNRVHIAYQHRVIMKSSTLGCIEYGGLTKMFARVQLSGPWHFSQFKDDLTDDSEREELEEAIQEALRPILEKCNSASMSAKIDKIRNDLNEMIPPEMAAARPKRPSKPRPPPPPAPPRPPGIIAPDISEDGGPAKSPRIPHDTLIIGFDGVNEEDGMGRISSSGRKHKVDLSRDNPYVAQLLEHRDEKLAASSLYVLAIVLFEQGLREKNPQRELTEPFGVRIAKLLAMQGEPERLRA